EWAASRCDSRLVHHPALPGPDIWRSRQADALYRRRRDAAPQSDALARLHRTRKVEGDVGDAFDPRAARDRHHASAGKGPAHDRIVLLGHGEALFAGIDLPALGYECVRHVAGVRATHVFLRKRG